MTETLRVLLVDDDPNDRRLVRETLEQVFPALALTEVAEPAALDRSLQEPAPDLVLTDYALGWTSGLVVLGRVKARWPDIPVLMVTGTGSEEIAVECMKEGLDDYILKSSRHIVRLPAAIRAALERIRERRALREAETRYQSLFVGVPVGLYRADASGNLIDANPALARILGCADRAQAIGTNLMDLCIAPEDMAAWRSLLTGEWDRLDAECRLRCRDGVVRWVEIHSRAVQGAGGVVLHVEGSFEDVTQRRTAEIELRRQHDELRTLAARLTEAEETERQRLARELHDQVGQNLTALGISLSIVLAQLPAGADPAIQIRVQELLALVEQTTTCIRGVMADLRPPVLDDYGLVAAVGWYARRFGGHGGLTVEVTGAECEPRLATATENALFRITQEALNNIAKHAKATRVRVAFDAEERWARLTIADDGVGFDATGASDDDRAHWGLRIMRERADGIGGMFRVESAPGRGTRISVEVPR